MAITFDPNKNQENITKHGIDLSDVDPVFYNDSTLGPIEDNDHNEQRFVVIGMDALGRIVVVVYAYDDEEEFDIRVISARKALPHEIREFQR